MSSPQELNYDVIQEPWNSYELEDGLILKTRLIVKRVFRKKEGSKGGYDIGSQNLTVLTHIPESLIGKKAQRKYSQKEIASAVIRDNVRFKVLREEWNEYSVEDGANIRVKLTVMNVGKTSLFDENGEPIYLVNSSTMIQLRPPKIYTDF